MDAPSPSPPRRSRAGSLLLLLDITEQVEREQRLSASEDKFAKAFHSSPDAITISELATGNYLEVNDGFSRLTGYSSAASKLQTMMIKAKAKMIGSH